MLQEGCGYIWPYASLLYALVDVKSRTFDQMIQAARSGKQNIVEGTVDKSSSYEMMLKLVNVARGSLKELLEDYKDYLRVNKLKLWHSNSQEVEAMRRVGIDKQTLHSS